MKRTIDALTIHYFAQHNPRLAKKWCEYTGDEMLHDAMFAADLEKVGVNREQIYAHEPLWPTKLLQGYFYYGLEHEGRPLASLCSSYFIEYASQTTQPQIIANLGRVLGAEMRRCSSPRSVRRRTSSHSRLKASHVLPLFPFPFVVMDVMQAAAERASAGKEVLHLEVGQPGTGAPAAVLAAAERVLRDDKLGYTVALGLPALRQAIANHYARTQRVNADAERIVLTPGSSGAFAPVLSRGFRPRRARRGARTRLPLPRQRLLSIHGHLVLD